MNPPIRLGLPLDLSLASGEPGSARTEIYFSYPRLALDLLSGGGEADRVLAFASLLVFARMTQQERLYVQLDFIKGCAALRFEAEATLGACLAALSIVKAPTADYTAIDLHIRPGSAELQSPSGYRMTLTYVLANDGMGLFLDYDKQDLSAIAAQDLLEKIVLLITAVAQEPGLPASDVSLITQTCSDIIPDPRKDILTSSFECIHTTVLRLAERLADQPAVSDGEHCYSYYELRLTILHLARGLIAQGVKPGDVVGVAGISSFGTLASIIAVMAAGGIMVTLDQTLPPERQKQIATISGAEFTIKVVPAHIVEPLEPGTVHTVDWPRKADLSMLDDTPLPELALPQDAGAYLFFTSGSTGLPKGVLGAHLGLAHFLDWQRRQFPIGPGDRSAQLTALSFDVVLRDILFPLSSGACVMIPNRELIFDARKMLAWMLASKITVLHSVPSLMKAWLQAENGERHFQTLRYIFFAGEPLADSLLMRFRNAAGPDTRITNLYGPTETTLAKLANPIVTIEPGIQPVGIPQPGVDVYIVRDRKVLCGLGEMGEIAIRTPYRSKGYFKNDDLTRQVFVQNPFRDDPQDLIYFTGDLGRYRSDKKIEIFGRIDSQIKIRGVRIEPNEIEAQLLLYPGIKDAAITTRLGAHDNKILYAFVVAETEVTPSEAADFGRRVRDFLKSRLHEAMVPTRILLQNKLPYLPNGKLDRKTLGTLDVSFADASAALNWEDLGEVGEKTQKIVVGLEDILGSGITDINASFIDLGGDSLSYIQASLLIEAVIGWLPDGWESMPLIQVARGPSKTPQRTSVLGMPILLRAISIVLVVVVHFSIFDVIGTTTLFVIAGMSFGRFQLHNVLQRNQVAPIFSTLAKIALPAITVIGVRQMVQHSFNPFNLLLIGTLFPPEVHEGKNYWFIDVLVQSYILLAILLYFPRIRELARQQLYNITLAAMMVSMGLAMAQVKLDVLNSYATGISPVKFFWLIFLGVGIICSQTPRQKLQLLALTMIYLVAAKMLYSADEYGSAFDFFFLFAVPLLLYVKQIRLPKVLVRLATTLASASLFIYLTNMTMVKALNIPALHELGWLKVLVTLAVGVLAWSAWNLASHWATVARKSISAWRGIRRFDQQENS